MLLTIIFFHFSVIMQLFYNRNLGCQWRIFHSAYAGISLQTALLIMHGKNYVLHLIYCNIVMLSFILLRLRMRLSLFHMHEYMNKLNGFLYDLWTKPHGGIEKNVCMIYWSAFFSSIVFIFIFLSFLWLLFFSLVIYWYDLFLKSMRYLIFFFLLNRKQQS